MVSSMMILSHYAESIGFVCGTIVNTIFAYCIVFKSRKEMGSYKYVMLSFAIYGLVYNFVEFITQPLVHIHRSAFVIICQYKTWALTRVQGAFLASTYSAFYGMTIVLLSVHFIYRYFVICRRNSLIWFRGYRALIWPLGVLVLGVEMWYCSFILDSMSDDKDAFLNQSLYENYEHYSEEFAYMGPKYFDRLENGTIVWSYAHVLGTVSFLKTNLMSSITIFVCGIRSYNCIKKKDNNMHLSQKTKDLQNQLFKALVFQTLIPVVFMYGPVGSLLIIPFFEIEVGSLANIVSINFALYPTLDPLAALWFIRDYRVTVTDWFRIGWFNNTVDASIVNTAIAPQVPMFLRMRCSSR